MKNKLLILWYLLLGGIYSFSANNHLKQMPPKYNIRLNQYEYFVLINATEEGVLKYQGNIDYSVSASEKNGEVVWEITTTSKNVIEALNIYVAQKSVSILTEMTYQNRLDEILLKAVRSLSMKLDDAVKNPVYTLQTLVGQVESENGKYYFISGNGDKRLVRQFSDDMSNVIQKPIAIEGYIKDEGFIIADRYRFIRKNTLELFVMSQCPYGIEALKYLLKNDSLLEANNIQTEIHFIFYKNGDSFFSLHGENETQENLVWMVLQSKYPNWLKPYLKERINHPNDSWKNLTSSIGLKQSEIKQIEIEIFASKESLIKTEYEYSTKIYNGINASPSYVWESVVISGFQDVPVFAGRSDYLNTQQCNN
jgi:hypothetical protein